MAMHFTLEYWIDDEWYMGRLKEVPGVFSQGETLKELEENIQAPIDKLKMQTKFLNIGGEAMVSKWLLKKSLNCFVAFLAVLAFALPVGAAKKIKLGSGVKQWPPFYLPIVTAEEQGFWKQNLLDVEWVAVSTTSDLMRAVAAEELKIGVAVTIPFLQAAAGGLPVIIVAAVHPKELFSLWVRADSPIREPKELRGARIGVARLGGSPDAFGRYLAKSLGFEKEVKFSGLGGVREVLAGLKAGRIDGTIQPPDLMVGLKVEGVVREVANMAEFLPREWMNVIVFSRKDFVKAEAETLQRLVKAILEANRFIMNNPAWSVSKLQVVSGFSEEAAKEVHRGYDFSRDGKLSRKALENTQEFVTQFGLVSRERMPPLEQLYTEEFTR